MSELPVGYGKPPKHTQFVKGRSGNPNGRPKGSQNLAALLHKIGRQKVKVTENGRARLISKLEAILIQLISKALRGDVGAIHEFRYWIQFLEESAQTGPQSPIKHENDEAVMASILNRIRQAEDLTSERTGDSSTSGPLQEEK